MHKRGTHLLPDGEAGRAEPIVTYSRVTDVPPVAEHGRIEPHFNAVRVDPARDRLGGDPVDDIETLPLVDAPPSHVSLDPLAEATAGEIRHVRRRRGPRVALLAGAIAVLAGAGVLAFAYNGAARLDTDAGAAVVAGAPAGPPALVVPESIDATGRSVRVVSADQIPPFASETAALAPRAVADPAAGEAALSDQATVSGEAALSAAPPGRVIADPPLPRLRPATASYNPPQTAAPESEAMVGVAAIEPAPALNPAPALGPAPLAAAPVGNDVDSALANVDRILSGQRAASADVHAPVGTGDDEFYGPVYPGPQPLPYPVMEPVRPVGQQGYPAYPQGAVPGDPAYPADGVYAADGTYLGPAGQVYADGSYPPQPLYPGVDLAADPPPSSPWWLPKRRPVVVPNGPVPPASIPNAQGPYYGTW